MFDFLVLFLFFWLFFRVCRLLFQVAWGLAKVFAVVLVFLALPSLIGCLLYAGGVILLLPVILIGAAWGLLKICL